MEVGQRGRKVCLMEVIDDGSGETLGGAPFLDQNAPSGRSADRIGRIVSRTSWWVGQELTHLGEGGFGPFHLRNEVCPRAFAGDDGLGLDPDGDGESIRGFAHELQFTAMDRRGGNAFGDGTELFVELNRFLGLRWGEFDQGQLLSTGGELALVAGEWVRLQTQNQKQDDEEQGGGRTPLHDRVSGGPFHGCGVNMRAGFPLGNRNLLVPAGEIILTPSLGNPIYVELCCAAFAKKKKQRST